MGNLEHIQCDGPVKLYLDRESMSAQPASCRLLGEILKFTVERTKCQKN